jgi:hypothetical protein
MNEPATLDQVNGLFGYLNRYGSLLGQRAIEALDPLHVPGRDEPVDCSMYLRTPKTAQAGAVTGAVLLWSRHRSGILCGEMGVGKTLIGAVTADARARFGRRPGFRSLIMAPNHLMEKWMREILKTIPGARVYLFDRSDETTTDDSYKGFLRYIADCRDTLPRVKTMQGQETARPDGTPRDAIRFPAWKKPEGPEFVIVGTNQAKWDPKWNALGQDPRCEATSRRLVVVDVVAQKDGEGNPIFVNRKGKRVPKVKRVTDRVISCPKCGRPVRDEEGHIIDPATADEPLACGTKYLQEIDTPDRRPTGYDRICPIPKAMGDMEAGRVVDWQDRKYEVRTCGEHLWTWTAQPRKWAPARIIHRLARGLFDYFFWDECHDGKTANAAQTLAGAKLSASARRTLEMTGTLIGGKASDLYAQLWRVAPGQLRAEGFEWGRPLPFSREYGRIDTIITTKTGGRERASKVKGSTSMRKEGKAEKREEVKPGIMPALFAKQLIEQSVFLTLPEMGDELPEIMDDERSLIAVPMDEELNRAYRRVEEKLVAAAKDLLKRGSKKLLGTMLRTLLDYPDRPFEWTGPYDDLKAIGYWDDPVEKTRDTWVGVVTPDDLDQDVIRPKEQALLDLCLAEYAEGRQVWVYCEMTCKRDVQGRLATILKNAGLRVKILRSGTVGTREREAWIIQNAPHCDVIISHPKLVSTGLDFFDEARTYNLCTIVRYETTYETNVVRQSGRRHHRVGQWKKCKNFYIYYTGTMQERAVSHVGLKLSAAKQLEGQFSPEGLALLAGDDNNAHMALAKSLEQAIPDAGRAWSGLNDTARRRVKEYGKAIEMLAEMSKETHSNDTKGAIKGIAQTILQMPDDGKVVSQTDAGEVELGREDLARFFAAMQGLGLSLADLPKL